MSTKVVELKTVKVGKYIVLDGEASKVTSLTTSSPGKHGAAKARLEAVGIFDGQKRSLVKPVDTKVEVPILDKRIGQILAIMGDQVQIMDLETYETMELAIPDEFADDIRGAVGTDLGVEYIVAMGNMKIMRTKKV
ncbi:MAG: translation initiation factor IF-5A [Methanobrevibacter sp.]|jgi:translation initiation factor 5A|nr:translation initiation factor IF-5A [Methanobrevibacter sp.]MDO5826901.1 translation initiation factor IF-5A [Methanobrevibacter sp.]MEE3443669.1 translation initiation factor IF-5A [Methanobrevibacter sp.]